MSEENLSTDRLRKEQLRDSFCKSIKPGKMQGKSDFFYGKDGLIYKRRQNSGHALVIPRSLVKEVIAMNHVLKHVAHPGKKRTLNIVKLKYWWQEMRKDIAMYVQQCQQCQRRNKRKAHDRKISGGNKLLEKPRPDSPRILDNPGAARVNPVTFMRHTQGRGANSRQLSKR